MSKLLKFLEIIAKFDNAIEFQMLEIGAHPYEGCKEPFHQIIEFFPKSNIFAFLYGSLDLAHYCLIKYDEKNKTDLTRLLKTYSFLR
tara:strand:+ start:53 stop:313 length:261 start_codon:yes stop_codon:yes gene_type:complete